MKNKKFDLMIKSSVKFNHRVKNDLFLHFLINIKNKKSIYWDNAIPENRQEYFFVSFNVDDITTGLQVFPSDELLKQYKLYKNTSKMRMYLYKHNLDLGYNVFFSGHSKFKFNKLFKSYRSNGYDTRFSVHGERYYGLSLYDDILNYYLVPSSQCNNSSTNRASLTFNYNTNSILKIDWLEYSAINKILSVVKNKTYYYKVYYFNNKKQKKICNSYFRLNIVEICEKCLYRIKQKENTK